MRIIYQLVSLLLSALSRIKSLNPAAPITVSGSTSRRLNSELQIRNSNFLPKKKGPGSRYYQLTDYQEKNPPFLESNVALQMTTNSDHTDGESTAQDSKFTFASSLHQLVPMISLKPLRFLKQTEKSKGSYKEDSHPPVLTMPQIGFGTYKFKKGSGEAEEAILKALRVGYRRIDTAFVYGGEQTESEVGRALQQAMCKRENLSSTSTISGLDRSDFFITTKQWRAYHGYEPTKKCLAKSLERLEVDFVDLYLMHWPGPNPADIRASESEINVPELRAETWRSMEDLYLEGKCRAIGVSNCSIVHLESLKRKAKLWPPAVNQIEVHPYHPQTELVEYCQKEGITVEAYASLGGQDSGKKTWKVLGGKLLERTEVHQIAQKHSLTNAQVLLQWAAVQGYAVIPKSTKLDHMVQNLEALTTCWSTKEKGGDDSKGKGSEEDLHSATGGRLDASDMEVLKSLDLSHSKDETTRDRLRLCWVRDPLKMLDFE